MLQGTMMQTRRHFIRISLGATAAAVPATWCRAEEVSPNLKIKLRVCVASDLHYGQKDTPYAKMADDLVGWVNEEKKTKGLDALFLNGDLTNDSSEALLTLRDGPLSKLQVPFHTIKGNHDFIDERPGSLTESWQKIWGYPSNHTVKYGDFVFIMADTSAPRKSDVYLAADIEWLKKELEAHKDAPAIFVMIHIPQRKQGVEGWPQHGVHDAEEVGKAEAVMDLLESTGNVSGIFHGHNHDETAAYVSGEKRYFFDSHVGGSWGAKKGYRILEIYEDHRMLTYQMNAEDDIESNRDEIMG
jgi:3',5'-cyclic AMP phosphodiesterase CpdA